MSNPLVTALNRWMDVSLRADTLSPYLDGHWDWLVYTLLTLWLSLTIVHQFLFIPFTRVLQRWDVCWVVPCYRLFEKPSSIRLLYRSSLSANWLEYELQPRKWWSLLGDPSFLEYDLTLTLCSRVLNRKNQPGLEGSYCYRALSSVVANLPNKPVQFAIWQNGEQAFLSSLQVHLAND